MAVHAVAVIDRQHIIHESDQLVIAFLFRQHPQAQEEFFAGLGLLQVALEIVVLLAERLPILHNRPAARFSGTDMVGVQFGLALAAPAYDAAIAIALKNLVLLRLRKFFLLSQLRNLRVVAIDALADFDEKTLRPQKTDAPVHIAKGLARAPSVFGFQPRHGFAMVYIPIGIIAEKFLDDTRLGGG